MCNRIILMVIAILSSISPASYTYAQSFTGDIFGMAWSPNEDYIALVGSQGAWIYTITTNSYSQFSSSIMDDVAWSPNGQQLATVRLEFPAAIVIEIWDVPNEISPVPQLARTITDNQSDESGRRIRWSPSGTYVFASGEGLHIWDADTGIEISHLEHGISYVHDVAWNLDESNIIVHYGHPELVRHILNFSSGDLIQELPTADRGSVITWKPGNNEIAISEEENIQIWDKATTGLWELKYLLPGNESGIQELQWANDVIVSYDFASEIRIWNPATQEIIETIPPRQNFDVQDIAISDDGTKIAYGSNTGTIEIGLIPHNLPCNPTKTVAAGDVAGLITAINTANANPDADVIGLAAGTYTFTAVNNNRNALPRITTDITICSTDGATLTRSSAAPQFRFFEVRSTGKLTLENLTLTNGSLGVDDDGGAIFNLGTLTVNNVTFSNNQAGVGGAIASEDGQVSVTDSTFTDNASTGDGGAIHSEADLLIENSTFTGNTADDAGAVNNDGGTLTVTDSTFSDNSADDGGAIYNDAGTLTLSGSTFTNNAGDAGGALDNLDGQAQIDSSTFTGNSASDGGAIRNYGGTVILTTSAFTGNMATDDGGALNNSGGAITITDTRLENNTATTRGGAIYSNSSGTMSAHNSCISGNSATAVYSASTSLQDFTGNWWGAANGPGGAGPGSGDTVNSKINHANFLTAGCPLP